MIREGLGRDLDVGDIWIHLEARHLLQPEEQIEIGFGRIRCPTSTATPTASAPTRIAESCERENVFFEGRIDFPFGHVAAIEQTRAPAEAANATILGGRRGDERHSHEQRGCNRGAEDLESALYHHGGWEPDYGEAPGLPDRATV